MSGAPDAARVFADTVAEHGGLPQIELAILSRQGGRDHNEDACGHWHSLDHLCCVVADGAGGHGGGDIAARLAVRHIIEQVAATPVSTPGDVHELLVQTNADVLLHRADGEAQRQMHSTVVALFIDLDTGQALWGHAGDSRLYVFRDGRVLAHTRDHSVVQALVEAGLLTQEETRNHPRRSELHSALGTEAEDLCITTVGQPWPLVAGDVFLLCTDGLWEYVDDAQMCDSLDQARDPSAWLTALEQIVLRNARAANKPHHDNFSGVAVWIGQPSR